MRIIGAGWGRTGTTSLTAALEKLGAGPCLHMQKMWDEPAIADAFARHLDGDGDEVDWSVVLADYDATTDWPGCWIWRELAEAFPDAPVVLTVRDPGSWYDSVRATIHPATRAGADLGPPHMRALMDRLWAADFGGWDAVLDRDAAIAAFERHIADVRTQCPPDRFVEWTVADGWEPICAALGVPVPDEAFPHKNDRAAFEANVDDA